MRISVVGLGKRSNPAPGGAGVVRDMGLAGIGGRAQMGEVDRQRTATRNAWGDQQERK
jgi:hypothetical protein